jgi:hypothetical protein
MDSHPLEDTDQALLQVATVFIMHEPVMLSWWVNASSCTSACNVVLKLTIVKYAEWTYSGTDSAQTSATEQLQTAEQRLKDTAFDPFKDETLSVWFKQPVRTAL